MTPTESLFWTNATRTHDWRNLQTPLRLLEAWITLGLVGRATWIEGKSGRRRKVSFKPDQLAEALQTALSEEEDLATVRIGGTAPREWAITALLFPQAKGMSLFNLRVDCGTTADVPPSHHLQEAFLSLYSPQSADAAVLHTDPQWTQLATGPYRPPLVTTPTFAGVFWANFIGPGHLTDFSISKLKSVKAYQTEWRGDDGLFLIATPTIDESITPSGEAELLRLTAEFRSAKPG